MGEAKRRKAILGDQYGKPRLIVSTVEDMTRSLQQLIELATTKIRSQLIQSLEYCSSDWSYPALYVTPCADLILPVVGRISPGLDIAPFNIKAFIDKCLPDGDEQELLALYDSHRTAIEERNVIPLCLFSYDTLVVPYEKGKVPEDYQYQMLMVRIPEGKQGRLEALMEVPTALKL